MIAQIIVNHNSRQIDKLFDYIIPDEFTDCVGVGTRVMVPFGRGNREIEGYVVDVVESSKTKRLKEILRIVDERPAFNEKTVQLINFMREKYLCKYLDIVHAIIPAGIQTKAEEWIVLINKIDCNSVIKDKILLLLSDNQGGMEVNALAQNFENGINTHIRELIKLGAVQRQYRDVQAVKDKKVKAARICQDIDNVSEIIEVLEKKAPVQCKILDILSYNEHIALTDIIEFSGGSYNAIASLVKKNIIEVIDITINRDPFRNRVYKKEPVPELNAEQTTVFKEINEHIEKGIQKNFLLHGVTGSGKTEVFIRAIETVLKMGKTAIVLVPEISLTPQMVNRFKARFDERVAVFHSGLSLGEKYDEWKKMQEGKVDIAIGARSAIFAPFDNIGIIIMDEQHEQTYKSEMSPRYDTKEIADFRAKQYNAVFLMASATPDIESYYKAKTGVYTLLEMKERVNSRVMPRVDIVDMREELQNGNKSVLSNKLFDEIQTNLDNKEQTILFLNRRGFSTFVSCRNCGFVAECPNCNISLTYHKLDNSLRCHYCGYKIQNYNICPSCESKYIRYFGGGTQRVEQEINNLFPNASTIRMDVDTTGGKFAHEDILSKFEKDKIDILIGTQMVTKGLDFPNVTLVGVISADTMLHIDDFRSGERTFAVLEQVSGRAGRGEKCGRAIVQTYTPEHESIVKMKDHDYISFYNTEIQMRQVMWYPPFCDIISVLFSGDNEKMVMQASRFFAKQLGDINNLSDKVQILGPIPAAISKIKNKFRWRMIIKCDNAERLNTALTDALYTCYNNKSYEKISIIIDKNPNNVY